MDGSCAQLGFRVATVDFVRHYLFRNSVKSSWELGIGADTLAEHVRIGHSLAACTSHCRLEHLGQPVSQLPVAKLTCTQLSSLQERATNAALAAQAHRTAESSRVAAALAQIEADRDSVRNRAARDKLMRTRGERLAREAADKENQSRMEMDVEV